MATIQQMAQWIRANQDKIGTPEFQTVAGAYAQERQRIKSQVESENQQWMAERTDLTQGMSGPAKFAAGAGKALTDIGRGVGQVAGIVPQESIDAARVRDAPLMQTGAGVAGNLVGNLAAFAPTALIPGVNTATGAALSGAAIGALSPTTTGESRLQNTAMGAGMGFAGNRLAAGLARALAPKTSPQVTQLMSEGVTPTPGQILGGAADAAEQAMSSVPILGTGVRGARDRAVQDFNRAAIARAMAPIGAKVDDIGYEGIAKAGRAVSQAYDDAIAQIGRVDLDDTFDASIAKLRGMVRSLPPTRQRQFNQILQDDLFAKITPARTTSGISLKEADSLLGEKAARYMKSMDGDQQSLGEALKAAQGELRALAARTSPEAARALRNADTAYAMMVRLENAAGRTGSKDGVFTPAALGQAARQTDRSLRKTATARGQALMQDFAGQAEQVLGKTLPNSGTADRLMLPMAFGGGIGTAMAPAAALPAAVAAAGGIAAGRAAYSPTGQKLLAALLTQRSPAMLRAGEGVRALAPYAGITGALMGTQQ